MKPFATVFLLLLIPFSAVSGQSKQGLDDAERSGINAQFGQAVAILGDWAFVGEAQPRLFSGPAVYVLHRENGAWVAADTLTVTATGESFGSALSATGNRLFVGAPTSQEGGAVYVFEQDAQTLAWAQTHRLTSSVPVSGAGFGTAIDATEDVLVVGAPYENGNDGRAYVFEPTAGVWAQTGVLSGTRNDGGLFGFGVTTAGNGVVIGAQYNASRTGYAYAFTKGAVDGKWVLTQEFTGSVTVPGSRFGRSLSASGSWLVVGAPLHNDTHGGLFVFEQDAQTGTWTERQALTSGVPATFRLGWSVATSGEELVAGGYFSFYAHAFTRQNGAYGSVALLGDGDFAMWSADVHDGRAIVGLNNQERAVVLESGDSGWATAAIFEGGTTDLEPIAGRVACSAGAAAGFACRNMNLLSFLPIHELGTSGSAELNDIWGWTDPETGTEYALVGRTDGVAFVSLADPTNPVYIGSLPTATVANTWRDVKVIRNHAVIVGDAVGQHGMQVFDLTQLRTAVPPATFAATAHYTGVGSAHNVVANEAAGMVYIVGASGSQSVPPGVTCGPGPHIVDMTDPSNPVFAGCYNPGQGRGYTHDAQCLAYAGPDADHSGKHICFSADEVGVTITDVTDPEATKSLSLATYPAVAYTHQGWLSSDARFFFVNDELDERNGLVQRTRTIIYDVSDLDDPVYLGVYDGETTAIDHNLYTRGNLIFESNYRAGLRVIEMTTDGTDPVSLDEVAYFDVYPPDDAAAFNGAWSVYPYFESGIILISGIESGLFVVELEPALTLATEQKPGAQDALSVQVYPNPAARSLSVSLDSDAPGDTRIDLFDALGRRVTTLHTGLVPAGSHTLTLPVPSVPAGAYFVRMTRNGRQESVRIILNP